MSWEAYALLVALSGYFVLICAVNAQEPIVDINEDA